MTTASRAPSGRIDWAGDIRFFATQTDFGGWYRLDGRLLTALPFAAQVVATGLGLAANLPNARDRHLRRRGALGSVFGTTTVALGQANMPNIAYGGNTNNDGGHGHAFSNANWRGDGNAAPRGGAPNNQQGGTANITLAANDNVHNHTVTIATGGGGIALDKTQPSVTAFAFVYLA